MEEKTQHPMTKDKILSAEEFLWKFIMTQTGTPETDMASIEDMSKMPEFSRMVGMLNDYATQFHPPTMTEEELRKEAEREYKLDKGVSWGEKQSVLLAREAHIKARKMGAIKMDREENLTQQDKRDIAEKVAIHFSAHTPQHYVKEYLDENYPLK